MAKPEILKTVDADGTEHVQVVYPETKVEKKKGEKEDSTKPSYSNDN